VLFTQVLPINMLYSVE